MLSKASSSSISSISFWFVMLMFIMVQPVISSRKLAATPTGNGNTKIGVHGRPSPTGPSATGGQSSPTPVTKKKSGTPLTVRAVYKGQAVCSSSSSYRNCYRRPP